MSDDLLQKLRILEEDYFGMPAAARRSDLVEINELRSQLGMLLVDDRLVEIGDSGETTDPDAVKTSSLDSQVDQQVSEEIQLGQSFYEQYLEKQQTLTVHCAYAEQVAAATAGGGQTPVQPLATMGTDGGPLLCDHCLKPIVLEGGNFHGVNADEAWQRNPKANWKSYILGGMVVEIQSNGTLRIYHGYPGRSNHCCNVAHDQDQAARAASNHMIGSDRIRPVTAFVEWKFKSYSSRERDELVNNILDVLFGYDPGIGVNRPRS